MNWKRTTLSVLVLTFGMLATGCAERHYRAYDPYYNDYHEWGPGETVYYRQWYGENYHNRGYRDYRKLNKGEQRNYWNWRHSHGDHDHDNDHRHDHDQH
jgi:hypothetical protein